jgi:hypothetical protein
MSKRYYYTCPIKALYMMKEFEVLFYLDDGESSTHPFIRNDEDEFEIADHELLKRCEGYNKIYIEEESEHIFEPKKGDKDENGLFFDGKHWTDGISYAISSEQSKTSFRFGKQFFMPEVENE